MLAQAAGRGVEIRLHATTLYASLFRYDETLVNPHAFGEAASANPTLHLRRLDGSAVGRAGGMTVGRIEYLNDPNAPKANTLVPACGVLTVDDQGRILLQRRRDTGQWALPMGVMEIGETPSQCAVRETREETGILVEPAGFLGVYSDPRHIVAYTDGEIRQAYEVMLIARPVSGSPAVNDEASDVRWVESADLDALDIHETQWRRLRDYLSGSYPHVD
jgi:8-oxo-dGTP pyrophosphatase MutT (NUDIX family)